MSCCCYFLLLDTENIITLPASPFITSLADKGSEKYVKRNSDKLWKLHEIFLRSRSLQCRKEGCVWPFISCNNENLFFVTQKSSGCWTRRCVKIVFCVWHEKNGKKSSREKVWWVPGCKASEKNEKKKRRKWNRLFYSLSHSMPYSWRAFHCTRARRVIYLS